MKRDRGQRLETCDGHGVADVDGLAAGGTFRQPTQTVKVVWGKERLRTGMRRLWKTEEIQEFNTSSTACYR